MINLLSYVGLDLQYEVCLWALLGLISTVFDATLFKVNANLKQVWQMSMPAELSMSVQRILRTMISGIMLVQCFTVYVYLASYIILLYPIFLEERPILVLPWLLLSAFRKLLCELTSLAMGLGTCVLLGPGRPPCIKFVISKIACILPCFYMWMLVLSYYHNLKIAAQFKIFPAVLQQNSQDYGLELAVRRRKTKSLLGEDQLRRKLVASFYGDTSSSKIPTLSSPRKDQPTKMVQSTETNPEETHEEPQSQESVSRPHSSFSTRVMSEIGTFEDWFGSEVVVPRSDRVLEQFVLMLLRIGVFKKKENINPLCFLDSRLDELVPQHTIDYNAETSEPPPHVGSVRGMAPSYVTDYPDIFMKKSQEKRSLHNASQPSTEIEIGFLDSNNTRLANRAVSVSSLRTVKWEIEKKRTVRTMSSKKSSSSKQTNTEKPERSSRKSSKLNTSTSTRRSKESPKGKNTPSQTSTKGIQINDLVLLHHESLSSIDDVQRDTKPK